MPNSRLEVLFQKYYSRLATSQEIEELMLLIEKSATDEQLSGMLKDAWNNLEENEVYFSEEQSRRMLESILPETDSHVEIPETHPKTKWAVFRWKWYAAAALLLPLLTTVWWVTTRNGSPVENEKAAVQAAIVAGTNKAKLTLEDGSVISLSNTVEQIVQQGTQEIAKTDKGHLTYLAGESQTKNLSINTLTTPKGGQYQITLSDGTRVWLNAASSIRFPTHFPANERKVEIDGEVFFEVHKDHRRPFLVSFGNNEVKVLGTSFNIKHYGDEPVSQTTLVEGSVSLNSGGKKINMTPGQGARIDNKGGIQMEEVDVDQVTSWKDGYFNFQDSDIREVMRQISRWYDVEVIYESKISKKRFTGKLPRDENISELMAMLRYAGVNCRIDAGKIKISN